ncbi:MAG: ArsR/SmtB family transcription factor [Candidatus Eiseniibacteriota bacterium]
MKRRPSAAGGAPASPSARSTENYWILDRGQIECLASAPRQDVVDRLAAVGPLSVRELAQALGRQPSALYHHLAKLSAADLVVEAGTRVVNRRTERLWATPSPRMRLRRALSEPLLRKLTPRVVAALGRQLGRDFAAGIALPCVETGGPSRNLGFFRLVGRPSPRGLERINECLGEIAEILWRDVAPGAPLLAFGWTMAPLHGAGEGRPRRRPKRRRPAGSKGAK